MIQFIILICLFSAGIILSKCNFVDKIWKYAESKSKFNFIEIFIISLIVIAGTILIISMVVYHQEGINLLK